MNTWAKSWLPFMATIFIGWVWRRKPTDAAVRKKDAKRGTNLPQATSCDTWPRSMESAPYGQAITALMKTWTHLHTRGVLHAGQKSPSRFLAVSPHGAKG